MSVPDVAPDVILAVVVAVRWVPPICVAVIVQFPVEPGATYRPEVAPIVPQEADHATSSVVENCSDWLTMTVGFDGVIVKAEGVVPVKGTVCGLLLAESVKTSVELRVPGTDGLNTIEAVQLAEAPRLVPHVLLEMLNSPAFPPVIAMELMVMEDEVPLCSVTV